MNINPTGHPHSGLLIGSTSLRAARAFSRGARVALLAALVAASSFASACSTTHGVRRLADGTIIHTFRRDWTNAHLVVRGEHAFLVDAGFEREAPALAADLQAEGFDPSRLEAIILTHTHADHAGGAGWFHRRYGTRVIVGRGDETMAASGHNEHLCPTDDTARGRVAGDQAASYTPFTPDVVVDGSLSLAALTGIDARAVALPGHTQGSLVVVVSDAALVGDLFRGNVFDAGTSVHFYMCDLEDNRRDVVSLLGELAPRATTFFPGHFGPLERGSVEDTFGNTPGSASAAGR
ncbi:MAG: MBL fold metallo-hydrolase [Deltaproteobacteria bacterium]